MHLHRKPARDLGLQIHAAPAHHLVERRLGTPAHQLAQLGPLRLAQSRRPTRARARLQTRHALVVVAMPPVAQGLTTPAAEPPSPQSDSRRVGTAWVSK